MQVPLHYAVILGLALVTAAHGQQADPKVCGDLEVIRQRHHLPGLVAAVLEKGELTHIGVAGVRKLGDSQPMTINDQMHLGSCTKAMTATLLAMYVESGQLDWETTIEDALPQLRNILHEDYRSVTIRQLLTHRSGLPANSDLMHRVDRTANETQQRLELFGELMRRAPAYPPGSEFRYSNLGYMLAGLVAETIARRPWQELLRQRLFQPLGMKSAGFGPPGESGQVTQPWGHKDLPLLGMTPSQRDNPLVLGPAGRVHASVADWSRFIAMHLHHTPGRSLLSDTLIDELHTPQPGEHYALGWGVHQRDWARGVALSHAGSNTYWHAVVWISPRRDLAFLAATNMGGEAAAQACDEAVVSLMK